KRPSASSCPSPGEKLQVGVRLAIGLPAPSRPSTLNAITSPWRTVGFEGDSVSFPLVARTTRTSSEADAPRTDAVSVALPGATPVTTPARSTLTIFGRLDCQRTES